MKGVRAAVKILTRLPVSSIEPWPRYTAAWFWVPGLLAGVIWYLAFRFFGPTTIGMISAIGGEALLTGGLHWKGLANIFDGWTAPRRERGAIRRDAGIGASGALAVGLALWAFGTLWHHGGALVPAVWLLPPLWGRAVMAWGTSWRWVDPASGPFNRIVLQTEQGVGSWIPLLIAIIMGAWVMGFSSVNAFGITLLLVGLFMLGARRLCGGMNEDVLWGAALLTEIIALYFIIAITRSVI